MIKTGIIYLGDQLLYTQRNPHFSCPISDFDQSCQYIDTINYTVFKRPQISRFKFRTI